MKSTLFPTLALMAVPALAETLKQPLSVIIASNWSQGYVDGATIDGDDSIDIDLFDKTPKETLHLQKVNTFKLENTGEKHTFKIEREKWVLDFINCTFTVIEDPGIPIIHILLMGNNDDKPDDVDYQLNWNQNKVKLLCEVKNWMDVRKAAKDEEDKVR